jgi:ankyrin repeat protein
MKNSKKCEDAYSNDRISSILSGLDSEKPFGLLEVEFGQAIAADDEKRVEELANVNFHLITGHALMMACKHGSIKVVQKLLKLKYALLEHTSSTGENAFHEACTNGKWEVAAELLTYTTSLLTSLSKCGRNALHYACMAQKWNVVEELLKRDKSLFDARDKNGDSPYDCCKPENKMKFEILAREYGVSLSQNDSAQSSSLIDRVNALCDAVTNAAQIEFTTNVDLQRAINAGGIASTLSGVQKFLTETSQMYLEKGVDFAAQGSIAAKVQNTEKAFKAMMNEINPNTNPALASYLGRI